MFLPSFIYAPTSFKVPESIIETIFTTLQEHVHIPQRGIVNIAFLSDEEIQRLNREYRGIDRTTDVLSFHYFEDFSGLTDTETAGEIVLSESRIIEQAAEYGNTPEAEFAKLLIHSALHLLWYDHETDEEYVGMRAEEIKIEKVLWERIDLVIH